MAFDELEDEIDPQEAQRARAGIAGIARPSASSAVPPVSLRGLGAPALGGADELEARGLASHTAPRPMPAPSPLEAKTTADQGELSRLQTTGSGVSQVAKAHPMAGGILRGLGTAGSVIGAVDPLTHRALSAIPGTEEHHSQLLGRQAGRIGEDLGEQKAQAGIEETGARTDQATAAAEKDRADAAAAGQPKPKEEKWGEFAGFTDNDGTPLIREESSGQVVRASDKQAPKGFQPAKPAAQQKPDTPEQQFIDAEMAKGKTLEQAIGDYAKTTQKPTPEPGSFMPLYDEKGHVSGAWDPKSGRVVKGPAEGNTAQGAGIQNKATEQATKEAAPYQQMVDNATQAHELADMAAKGNASADVDLVLSFFKMMKGTGGQGVRFTQQEQNLILGARSAGQGLVAIGQKVIGEGQPLTPEQRANMVAVMDMHSKAAQQHLDTMKQGGGQGQGSGGGGPQRPANVPANYVYQQNGPKGEGWYRP